MNKCRGGRQGGCIYSSIRWWKWVSGQFDDTATLQTEYIETGATMFPRDRLGTSENIKTNNSCQESNHDSSNIQTMS
jgi:hypothetical protein